MDTEKKLETQIEEINQLGAEDKNVDTAALMMNALANQRQDFVDPKQKRRAYLVSILLPPFGLLYALKFYFDARQDARKVALTCVVLTALIIFFTSLLVQALFAGTGADLQQIEQINPADIQQLLQ